MVDFGLLVLAQGPWCDFGEGKTMSDKPKPGPSRNGWKNGAKRDAKGKLLLNGVENKGLAKLFPQGQWKLVQDHLNWAEKLADKCRSLTAGLSDTKEHLASPDKQFDSSGCCAELFGVSWWTTWHASAFLTSPRRSRTSRTRPEDPKAGAFRGDYRDLAIRQLGSVYEGLIEMRPRLAKHRRWC